MRSISCNMYVYIHAHSLSRTASSSKKDQPELLPRDVGAEFRLLIMLNTVPIINNYML